MKMVNSTRENEDYRLHCGAAVFIAENQLLWQLKWFQRYFLKLQFVRIQGLSGDSFKDFCYFVPLNFLSLTQTKYLFKSSSSKGKFVKESFLFHFTSLHNSLQIYFYSKPPPLLHRVNSVHVHVPLCELVSHVWWFIL